MNYISLLFELCRLRSNTKKTKEQIRRLQDKKLYELLTYAYENSAYYRNSFNKKGITKKKIKSTPLSEFPCIDKTTLIDNFDTLVTVSDLKQDQLCRFDEEEDLDSKVFRHQYHVVHSSGSTGKPNYFIYDNNAWNNMLVGIIRGALWNMSLPSMLKFLLKGPRVLYIAATEGRYGGAMSISDGIDGLHAKQLFLDINTPINEWIEKIRKFDPNMIIGYPSAIKILGELIQENNLKLSIERIVSCGEPLNSGLRSYLKKIFETEIYNFYGASESLALGIEDDISDGMYLFDDLNIIEVEKDCMYLTCLYNFAQPLIRYKLSDKLVYKKSQNGRFPFSIVETIVGRNEDVMWFNGKNGTREFLHPLAVEGICIEGLLDYQFRKIDDVTFEMIAQIEKKELQNDIRDEILKIMRQILCEKNLMHLQFFVRFTEEIMPNPKTGKKQLIVSE